MILKNLLYILQSEHYAFGRFLTFAYMHLAWWKLENRQKIDWTLKARLLWLMSTVLFWSSAWIFFLAFNTPGLLIIPVLIALLPFLVGASLAILSPLDTLLKQRKIRIATRIIEASDVTVIGITGSYGKTSAKEILATLLKQKFNVIKTPDNINTDIGIADFIRANESRFRDADMFVVEMGAYHKGDIEKICAMVRPTYSILTGINESHLERFGSLENIIQGKFELPKNTRALSVLNFDDENIKQNVSRFPITKSLGVSKDEAKNIRFKEKFQGLEFEWRGATLETTLLAEHAITLILLSANIALECSLSLGDIARGVKELQPVAHRLQPIYNESKDIMVIDDSYNGNYAGIVSGLQVLGRTPGRKVVLTPGLVELGSASDIIHERIGELYAKSADLVLLIKNKMTDSIVRGLVRKDAPQYKVYPDTETAHADLKNILKPGDTIIFQNDLTDNYF